MLCSTQLKYHLTPFAAAQRRTQPVVAASSQQLAQRQARGVSAQRRATAAAPPPRLLSVRAAAEQQGSTEATQSSDSDDRVPPGCSRYTVSLSKPLGLVLEEGKGGRGVYVVSAGACCLLPPAHCDFMAAACTDRCRSVAAATAVTRCLPAHAIHPSLAAPPPSAPHHPIRRRLRLGATLPTWRLRSVWATN